MYLEGPYLELETLGQMLKELSYPEKTDQIYGGELCCFNLYIELLQIDDFLYHYKFDIPQMWQSWVEIKHYSVAYFEHITAFEAL